MILFTIRLVFYSQEFFYILSLFYTFLDTTQVKYIKNKYAENFLLIFLWTQQIFQYKLNIY